MKHASNMDLRRGRGRTCTLFLCLEGVIFVKLLIRHGRLVDPVGGIGGVMDILIEDGKVAVIGSNVTEPDAQVIDATGMVVCSGLVDMHVHLREPGFEYKETIETGAAAAARGGFTSIACMPNTRPAVDCPEQIDFVKQKAAQAWRGDGGGEGPGAHRFRGPEGGGGGGPLRRRYAGAERQPDA